jgi:elongation factor Ts
MISASDVKRLRDATGAGMMDCKKALTEANGDFDAAIDILRKKGQKVSAKRADREAKEGVIVTVVSDGGNAGAIVELNCETDFVARNEEFKAFAQELGELVLSKKPEDVAALKSIPMDAGLTVDEMLTSLTGKIGEKIDVRRLGVLEAGEGRVVDYVHPGSRLGVLIEMHGNGNLLDVGRDVAMQVAAMNPIAVRREEVPESVTQKEVEIAREVAVNEGKPEQIVDRIATGKLERYFKDNVLLEQAFVKDSSLTVSDMLKSAGSDVSSFLRFALGD